MPLADAIRNLDFGSLTGSSEFIPSRQRRDHQNDRAAVGHRVALVPLFPLLRNGMNWKTSYTV